MLGGVIAVYLIIMGIIAVVALFVARDRERG